jgi:DNA-binding NtrC family response regulator
MKDLRHSIFMEHILVVDDDAQIRKSLTAILSNAGFTVRSAGSGKEAVASYRAEPTALVILDVYMPDMDGVETMQALHAFDRCVKVVAISGMGSSLSAICLKIISQLGALAILEKPFTREELVKMVRTLLGGPQEQEFEATTSPVHQIASPDLSAEKAWQREPQPSGK